MKKVRKLIDINQDILELLDKEARKQKRSLKSFLEYILEETAKKLETPSQEYMDMMDQMLERLERGDLGFSPIEEIKAKYAL